MEVDGIESDHTATQTTSPATLQRMFDASPVAHIKNIQTPILFGVGVKDRRCPCPATVEFFNILRASDKTTKYV